MRAWWRSMGRYQPRTGYPGPLFITGRVWMEQIREFSDWGVAIFVGKKSPSVHECDLLVAFHQPGIKLTGLDIFLRAFLARRTRNTSQSMIGIFGLSVSSAARISFILRPPCRESAWSSRSFVPINSTTALGCTASIFLHSDKAPRVGNAPLMPRLATQTGETVPQVVAPALRD